MGAYAEFQSIGMAGDQTCAMLHRCAKQVVARTSFPPPEGHEHWTDEACWDLLSEMFASTKDGGQTFVVGCYVTATDDSSFERLVLTAIENHLIDEAKKTERGKLRRRLATLLTADERFVRAAGSGGAWALRERAGTVWQGDRDDLLRAAFAVSGSLDRLNPAGPTPATTKATLLAVAHSVLTAAAGSVRDEDLAWVLQHRFALLRPPTLTTLTTDGDWEPVAPDRPSNEQSAAEATVASATALTLWASLSTAERAAIPLLHAPVAQLAKATGTGLKRAETIRAALREKLRLAITDTDDVDTLLGELLELCEGES